MLLDFALLGEKGKDGKFGMSDEELARRFTKGRDSGDALQERIGEYTAKKTDLTPARMSSGSSAPATSGAITWA